MSSFGRMTEVSVVVQWKFVPRVRHTGSMSRDSFGPQTESRPIVAVFECKQSREDLFRDNRRQSELKSSLLALQDRRKKLESLLAVHYPSLRTSDSLFPEWATFDFTTIDHRAYNLTIQKIVRIQRQLLENTKFDLISRYELSSLHYLATTPGLLGNREVPLGWGLLEVHGKEQINEKIVPTRFKGIETLQWLDRIAKAATAETKRSIQRCIA